MIKFCLFIFLFSSAICASIGHDNKSNHSFKIAIISDLNKSYGSIHYDKHISKVIHYIIKSKVKLVLITGDVVAGQISPKKRAVLTERLGISYKNLIKKMWVNFKTNVFDPLKAHGVRIGMTPGNHDGSGYSKKGELIYDLERRSYLRFYHQYISPQIKPKSGSVSIKQLQYSFEYQGFRFISLDATHSHLGKQQKNWLANRIQNNKKPTIIFGHLPLFPFAYKKGNEYIQNDDNLYSLIRKNSLLYFSGHHHLFYSGREASHYQVAQGCLGDGPRSFFQDEKRLDRSFTIATVNTRTKTIKIQDIDALKLTEVHHKSYETLTKKNRTILRDQFIKY